MPESKKIETIWKVIHWKANGKVNDWFWRVLRWECVCVGYTFIDNHHAPEMDLLQFWCFEQAKWTWLYITRSSVQAISTSAVRGVLDAFETIHFDNQESKLEFIAWGIVISTFKVLWSSYRYDANIRDVMGSNTVWVWSNFLQRDIIVHLIHPNQLYIPHQCTRTIPYWIHPISLMLK